MKRTKGHFLRGVALPFFIAAPAVAADLPLKAPPAALPPTVHNWSGFYAGVNAGGAWAYSDDPTTSVSCTGAGFPSGPYYACGDIPVVASLGTGAMSHGGFTGGAQAGYNWQINSTVLGVEADFDAFHPNASRTGTGVPPLSGATATITNSVDANWLFTARGRLGLTFGTNILGYVTGGLALTDFSAVNTFSNTGGLSGETWSASTTKVGWVVGAGAEYAFNRSWSLRAEYLYVHFDAINASGFITSVGNAYGNAISTSSDLSAQIARAGINYKF